MRLILAGVILGLGLVLWSYAVHQGYSDAQARYYTGGSF